MPKSSQRKGRNGEREIRDILKAAGWSACCKGLYEPLDIDWEGMACEVKREAGGMTKAYRAFDNGAQAYFHRADRKSWLITMELDTYIRLHGPEFAGDRKGKEDSAPALSSQDGENPSLRSKLVFDPSIPDPPGYVNFGDPYPPHKFVRAPVKGEG